MFKTKDVKRIVMDCVQQSVLPHMNILIVGRTGVGKGTLINSIFQGKYSYVGQGKPITKSIHEYTKEDIPLTIFDTRGLELADYEETFQSLERLILERQQDVDPNRHIHVAWICIQEPGRRVEQAEIELQNLLHRAGIPIVGVITKAMSDQGFKAEVQKLLPKTKNIVRVNSLETVLDGGYTVQPHGVRALLQATMKLVEEGQRQALVSSQNVLMQEKIQESISIINTYREIAQGVAVRLGMFQIMGFLIPVLVTMLMRINHNFCYVRSKDGKTEDEGSELLYHASKKIFSTIKFRFLLLVIMNVLPFLGTLSVYFASKKISHYVLALGYAYLETIIELNQNKSLAPIARKRFDQRFMAYLKRTEKSLSQKNNKALVIKIDGYER